MSIHICLESGGLYTHPKRNDLLCIGFTFSQMDSISSDSRFDNRSYIIALFLMWKVTSLKYKVIDFRISQLYMFSPRLRPLKGHERWYGSCKMNRIYFVQSSMDECKYFKMFVILYCSYVDKFTDFLRLFVSIHLRRFESNTQFPVIEFLALLFRYTFRQVSVLLLVYLISLMNIACLVSVKKFNVFVYRFLGLGYM